MGIEPRIDHESRDREYLSEKIIEASELLMDEDELTDETERVLDNLSEVDDEDDDLFE
jgi:hypothetical protein